MAESYLSQFRDQPQDEATIMAMLGLTPHQRMRAGQAAVASQYDRATPQDSMPVERGSIVPLATYANGMTGPALPGIITEPVESFGRLLNNGYHSGTGDQQGVEDAFNVAGATMTGGMLAPRPRGSVGMGGGMIKPGSVLIENPWNPGLSLSRALKESGAPKLRELFRVNDDGFPIIPMTYNDDWLAGRSIYGTAPGASNGLSPSLDGWHLTESGAIFRPANSTRGQSARELAAKELDQFFKPSLDYYYRGTNNKNELDLVAAGLMRRSKNYADNTIEDGLSVSNGPEVLWAYDYPYGYKIKGSEIGKGSDGEPVLDLSTLQAVTGLKRSPVLMNEYDKMASRIAEGHGFKRNVRGVSEFNLPFEMID